MGWSSGSELASKMIKILDYLHEGYYDEGLEEAYREMIDAFEQFDCDNLHECLGENDAFDTAFKQSYEDYYGEPYPEDEE